MVLKTNMLERMITIFSLESVMTAISGKVDILTGAMDSYLSNSGNLRTLSIILMMLAIVLFLFLIAVLYVKSLSSFLRAEQNRRKEDEKQSKSFFESMDDDIDAAELEKIRQEALGALESVKDAGELLGMSIKGQHYDSASEAGFSSSLGVPTICNMGPEGEHIHSLNEYLVPSSIMKRCKLIALTALQASRVFQPGK